MFRHKAWVWGASSYIYIFFLGIRVPHWLERLPDNRLASVQESAIAGKHLHQYPFSEQLLREMQIFYASGC